MSFRFLTLVLLVTWSAACRPTAAPAAPTRTAFATLSASATSTTPFSPTATGTPFATPPPSTTPTTMLASATPTTTEVPLISLVFTGIIVPARCVQAQIDALGNPDYPYEEVRDYFQNADLAIGTLNATITDYPPRTGCIDTFVLTGGAQNADALARAGIDVMSVATNHIKNCGPRNCGDRAFYDTLDNLRRVGILPVGAGQNLAEALEPIVTIIGGVRFGLISLGEIEPMAFAGPSQPGIAPLTEENLQAAISAAREVSDVVIVMPHWGPEYTPRPNYRQLRFARLAVEAGADLVVGNHTHVVQAIETINSVPVFYGLGNFVFDQSWSLETQQGVLLIVTFQGTRYASHELIPTHVDGDGRVHIANTEEANQILKRIQESSLAIPENITSD